MSQDAPKNGAMLFELATSAGRSLHAGVLDFTAAQGTVGVPEHLIRNLWGLTTGDGQCHGHIIVTYQKLPKGSQCTNAHYNTAHTQLVCIQSKNHDLSPLQTCMCLTCMS